MPSPAHESDAILLAASRSLVDQRAGGRRGGAIGRRSAELRRAHAKAKVARIVTVVTAILIAAMAAGLLIDGIGFTGVMLTGLAVVVAVMLLAWFPRLKVPDAARLNTGSVKTLVGNTELWLEAQRPALPAPAVRIVDQLGVQLDALGLQLEGLDEKQPQVAEVRKLVGEHLPELVSAYTAIPRPLRSEPRPGGTPDQQIAESLGRISAEIDHVTRQLAEGQLDKLAIRTKFLGYKYGDDSIGGVERTGD